jgi:AmmeMemoRadiSam system protein A
MSEKIDEKTKKNLLKLARMTIKNQLTHGNETIDYEFPEIKRGAFVTLHKHGELRGCIGTFRSDKNIKEVVQDMAIAAAFEDPRFPPLKKEELDEVDIEISILSPLKRIKSIDEIEVGKHGLYITRGFRSGVLLPQVATEYNWDRETFLVHTCLKAGLPEDAWRDPATKIETFTAEVFGEKDFS